MIPVESAWPGTKGPGQVEVSDDGTYVVYQANRGDGWKLYRQRLGEPSGTEIAGLGDLPYFGHLSPNGQWLLFGQKDWILKVPLEGGAVTKLYGANNSNMWETDDTIIIGRGANGLSRIPADGSMTREDIAAVDQSKGATNYGRPSALPNGKGVLVSVGFGTGNSNRHIGVVSLPSGELTTIPELGAIKRRYSESGHILYTVDNVLKAIPFDLDRMEVTGDAATIVEGVHVYTNQASQYDISSNGVLVYIPGPYEVGRTWPRSLVWVDRAGKEQAFDTAEHYFRALKLSPDGRYLAAEGSNGNALYLYDHVTGAWTGLAENAAGNGYPVWAADSGSLFYTRAYSLGRQGIDASHEWEELMPGVSGLSHWASVLSGTEVLLTSFEPSSPEVWRLGSVPTEGAPAPSPVLGASTFGRRSPALSADGNWLAYMERESNLDHVYVEPFPAGGGRVLVSEGDAAEPVWGPGMELFYRDATNMVSVRLSATPALRVVRRTRLFSTSTYSTTLTRSTPTYDFDPRTDRFIMAKRSIPNLQGQDIHVLQNAFELLNRLAPPR